MEKLLVQVGVYSLNERFNNLQRLITKSSFCIFFEVTLPISISAAKQEMLKSKLPNNVLGKIWKLSDVDKVS